MLFHLKKDLAELRKEKSGKADWNQETTCKEQLHHENFSSQKKEHQVQVANMSVKSQMAKRNE